MSIRDPAWRLRADQARARQILTAIAMFRDREISLDTLLEHIAAHARAIIDDNQPPEPPKAA